MAKKLRHTQIEGLENPSDYIIRNKNFDLNMAYGLMLSDGAFGGEAGLFDLTQEKLVAGIFNEHYSYGGLNNNNEHGLYINRESGEVGIGYLPSTGDSKLTVAGKVTANQFIKTGGVGNEVLLADGSTTQINQPNGVAGLDANGQVANAQLPNRIKDKTLMIPGEDTGHFGFMDRNILWDACGRGTTTMNLTGAGTIGEGNLKTLFNGNGDFLYIYGVDNTTQLVVTTLYDVVMSDWGNASGYQALIQFYNNTSWYFQDIKVELLGKDGVWRTEQEVTNIVPNVANSGIYEFPIGTYGWYGTGGGFTGIRFTLKNPKDGYIFLKNIGFRHINNALAPQFAHQGLKNNFYEDNEFKKPLIIPNGISSNHAITLAQLNGYVSISSLNTQLDNYVTKNGSVTINGTKIFTECPVIPTPTINTHAVNKEYVDGNLNNVVTTNTVQDIEAQKYLNNPFPLIFNDPTENTRRFGFYKPNNISSIILVPSTEPDSDNWNWANQIEFKENGKIKNKGYEIVGKDDDSVLTAGGNSSHKKELLWSRKLTIQPSSTNAYYPEPQGQVTNIDITGHGSIDATVYLPQEAYNGQIINIVNYSAEKIKISGIDSGYFGIGQDTMVTMTFVIGTNSIDGVSYGTGRWVGMYMNEFKKLE